MCFSTVLYKITSFSFLNALKKGLKIVIDVPLLKNFNSIILKLRFYSPRFYVFHEFTHLLRGLGQIHITDFTFPQFHLFPNLHFIFVALTMKISPSLHFVVQFSEFFIQGNRLIRKWISVKIHITNWLMLSCKCFACTMWLH